MEPQALDIEGAWVFAPVAHSDHRGTFFEAFTTASLVATTRRHLDLAQINCSISRQGTVRGIHGAARPPGQAKYVMCVAGEVMDVVVDLRAESPTFGQSVTLILSDANHSSLFISEGLGHGFCVLSHSATVIYATTTPYDPSREYAVNPWDPTLALSWPTDMSLHLSDRDLNASSLDELLHHPERPLHFSPARDISE